MRNHAHVFTTRSRGITLIGLQVTTIFENAWEDECYHFTHK